MRYYPVHDLHSPGTFLRLPEKRDKLYLFCRLNLLNFSSSDKRVSKRKCEHKNEISRFYPNLFISLTYMLVPCSTEVKERGKNWLSYQKTLNLILLKNLELLGYPALVRQGSLRVRTKGKLHLQLNDFRKNL